MKNTHTNCILTLILLFFSISSQAQFQRQFGTALDESFSKVLKSGNSFYVLGTGEVTNGQPSRATVTRINALGELQWTLSLNTASKWNDAVLTPGGDLMVVGQSLPNDNSSRGIMGLVTAAGTFAWVRSYDIPNRDAFTKIVRSPVPQNALYPYYVLGHQVQSLPSTDDVFLLNVDELGNLNWKKLYNSLNDDEFANDLEVLPNGHLMMTGNQGGVGVIFRADNTGAIFNAAAPEVPFSFSDLVLINGGGVYAVGYDFPNERVHLLKFDLDLIILWDVTISGMTAVSQVWQVPTTGDIYVTGTIPAPAPLFSQTAIYRLADEGGGAALHWVKYLSNNEVDLEGGTSSFIAPNQMAFADGRTPASGGFGQLCGMLSISDLELNTCFTQTGTALVQNVDVLFNSPEPPLIDFYDIPPVTNLTGSQRSWQQGNACSSPDPCDVAITVNNIDNCGHVQVVATSMGAQPASYQWCSGESTASLDVLLPCGPHTFCVSVTCSDGSMADDTETITITDNVPPTAVCAPGFGVSLDATCSFTLTTDLIDGGSTDNCPNHTLSINPSVINGCGEFPVVLTVTDWCGNTSSCTTSVQAIEVVPPVIMCPPNVKKDCNTDLDPSFTGFATAMDDCDSNPLVAYTDVILGTLPCDGVIQRTWTATDSCGNEASCVQNIIVIDNVAPMINCPPDLTVNTNPGQCFYTGILPQPTATDNCNQNPTVTCYLVTSSGAVLITPQTQFPKGEHTICCIADDGCVDISELICTYPCVSGSGDLQGEGSSSHFLQNANNNSPSQSLLANISIQSGVPASVLVKDIFVGGDCYDISNVTSFGQASQLGSFSNGNTNIGFESGIILATGPSTLAAGPNDSDSKGVALSGLTPDADLATLTSAALHDRASIEFDFIPTQATTVFRYAFASEEYCELASNSIHDVFGFFISGPGISGGQQNIALIPTTTTPVGINTVNHLINSGLYVNNQPAGSANLCGQTASSTQAINELQYDGFTRQFTAVITLQPGQTYHLKLAIADAGDGLNDSAIFLSAGSFDAGGDASVEWEVNSNPVSTVAVENCGTANLVFSRLGGNPNIALSVAFTISGSAVAGLDYAPFSSPIVIPAGQNQFVLPVTILNDAVLEGDETIVVTLNNACSFLMPQKALTIRDMSILQAKCTYTLTVEDHELPIIMCPPGVTVAGIANGQGSCTAVVGSLAPPVSDNCPMLMVDYLVSGATTASGANNASGLTFLEGVSTLVYTATDMSGNTASCQTQITVECDFGSVCNCPPGSSQGPNQITNGDFSAGNTGFTSDYNFTPVPAPGPGNYTVYPSFQNNFWSGLGHTTGLTTDNFLVADGSLSPGKAVWRQNVSVVSAADYMFCAYANNLWLPFENQSDPNVQVWMVDGNNNATLLASAILTETPDKWVKIDASWSAPVILVSPYRLEIRDGSVVQGGNDFAVDDISFKPCSPPPPCTASFAINQIDNCGHVQVTSTSTGLQPISYQWCSGESTPNLDVMLPCGPHTFCVSITCEDGSMSSATQTIIISDNIPPTISCPQNLSFTAFAPNCDMPVLNIQSLGATDNCGTPTVAYAITGATTASGAGDASGTVFSAGTSTVTYTATDWCNNMSSCSFDVTIECDTCACLGFQNMEFYNFLGASNISANCDSMPIQLPCIGPDALYWFQWQLQCSDAQCMQSVDYQIVSTSGGPSLVSGTVTGFPFLNFAYNQLSGPGNYQLILTGHCGTGSCTCTINFSLPQCCDCGGFSEMTYRPAQGVMNIPVACNDTLGISCDQTFEPRIGGLFQCVGTQCPLGTTLNWVLSDPQGNPVQSGPASANPGFSIALMPAWFNDPGLYTLIITGQCGGQPCDPCVFYFESEGCECCDDFEAFCDLVDQNFTVEQVGCNVTVCAPQFDACHYLGAAPDFGDGSGGLPVTVPANGCWSHTYTQSGTYTICATVFEDNCWNKVMCTTVTVVCPQSCECSSFSNMYIRGPQGTPTQPVACGGPPVPLECPSPGIGYHLTGSFSPGPTIKSIMIDACGTEADNEFIIIHSGANGFNVNDLQVDFDAFNNSGGAINNDINIGASACGWQTGVVGMFNGCPNVIAAGPGTFIPPDAYVVVQTSASVSSTALYDFTAFCGAPQDVYVIRNACTRSVQAFTNGVGIGTRTTSISVNGACLNSATYNLMALSNINGAAFIAPNIYYNGGCVAPPNTLGVNPNQVGWTLTGPGGTQTGTYSGNSTYFDIHLLSSYFNQIGLYTLTLEGYTQFDTCFCSISFFVDELCDDSCPCDITDLFNDVGQGFAQAFPGNSCAGCFTPLALNDCDVVEWVINNPFSAPVGVTTGNQTFCYSFPAAGTYTVYMNVFRKRADGSLCESFSKAQSLTVTCQVRADCEDSVFGNPQFNEGAVAGEFNAGGASDGWIAPIGNPSMVEGIGSADGWSVMLSGNFDGSDVLTSKMPVCTEKGSGRFSLSLHNNWVPDTISDPVILPPLPGQRLILRLYTGNLANLNIDECDSGNCYELAAIELPTELLEWFTLEIPYDLSNWEPLEACGLPPVGVEVRPVVFVSNWLGDGQPNSKTMVLVDELCMDGTIIVGLNSPEGLQRMRVFPNPNSGEFTVELAQSATRADMAFHVVDIAGRLLLKQAIDAGSRQQTVHASNLPAGLYFLQIVSEGKVLGVERFVKQ